MYNMSLFLFIAKSKALRQTDDMHSRSINPKKRVSTAYPVIPIPFLIKSKLMALR